MTSKVLSLLDFFLHPKILASPLTTRRGRFLVIYILLAMLVSLLVGTSHLWYAKESLNTLGLWLALFTGFIFLGVVKKIGNVSLPSNGLCLFILFLSISEATKTGGIYSLDLQPLICLPSSAYILGGKRSGITWLGITMATVLGFLSIELFTEISFSDGTERLEFPLNYYLKRIGNFAIASGLLVFMELTADSISKQLLESSEKIKKLHGEMETRHTYLLREMNEMVFILLPEGNISFANKSVTKHFNLPLSQLQGTAFVDLLVPEDQARWQQLFNTDKAGEKERFTFQTDAGVCYGQCSWFYNLDDEGNKRDALLTVYNRTEEVTATIRTKELINSQLVALKAQINPHFIFNAMNSVQEYILDNKQSSANQFLAKFARLVRNVLEFSDQDRILMSDEIETLKLYLSLENRRMDGQLNYQIKVAPEIDPEWIYLPPMLLQPYVENAIKHGLANKEEQRKLRIDFVLDTTKEFLKVTIRDNGVGRKASQKQTSTTTGKRRSMGTNINAKRLQLLNSFEDQAISVAYKDLEDNAKKPVGTAVTVQIPIRQPVPLLVF